MEKKLFILVDNHFDLSWRRRYRDSFVYKGRSFVPYKKIQEWYILDNLALAEKYPEYKFNVESVAVLREFLREHPEKDAQLTELYRAGRYYVTGSGDNIVDSNLIGGESLARNFISGFLWLKDKYGEVPHLAVRNDAFGNSAQIPQILRECGVKWVAGMAYSGCPERYWRGLDGSVVVCGLFPTVYYAGTWRKYGPCPACNGFGEVDGEVCPTCNGRGINSLPPRAMPGPGEIPESAFGKERAGILMVGAEEMLPGAEVPEWLRTAEEKYAPEFATYGDFEKWLEPELSHLPDVREEEIHPSPELNPNNTGCYVTRIRLKQELRRLEYALKHVETYAALALKPSDYPREALASLWEELFFLCFHDCVTAEHVDPADIDNFECHARMDALLAGVRAKLAALTAVPCDDHLTVFNLTDSAAPGWFKLTSEKSIDFCCEENGVEVLEASWRDGAWQYVLDLGEMAPFGRKVLKVLPGTDEKPEEVKAAAVTRMEIGILQAEAEDLGERLTEAEHIETIENERYRIDADEQGILRIFDKKYNRMLSEAGEYRPGEWIHEHDEGSPWTTLSPDCSRIPLAMRTSLVRVEREPGYQRLTFHVECTIHISYTTNAFDVVYSVALYKGSDEVRFEADANWDDFNHRMRVAFPMAQTGRQIYEIPYGWMERENYTPSFGGWADANGDWPAINWAGIETDDYSAALFNRGTPSYMVEKRPEGDTMLLSVLRSPSVPTYLHEPECYSMVDWDGMRDAGRHHFSYALRGYEGTFADSSVVADAERYVAGLFTVPGEAKALTAPCFAGENARITAVKRAEKGDELIVRLNEVRGRAGELGFKANERYETAVRTSMLEEPQGETATEWVLHPFEIATFRLTEKED